MPTLRSSTKFVGGTEAIGRNLSRLLRHHPMLPACINSQAPKLLHQVWRFSRPGSGKTSSRKWSQCGVRYGLWFGVASFFLFRFPVLGPLICVAAIVVSTTALVRRRPGASRKDKVFAIIGLVLGVIYTLMALIWCRFQKSSALAPAEFRGSADEYGHSQKCPARNHIPFRSPLHQPSMNINYLTHTCLS